MELDLVMENGSVAGMVVCFRILPGLPPARISVRPGPQGPSSFLPKGLDLFKVLDDVACVGCGRCASPCLPDIADPVDAFNNSVS